MSEERQARLLIPSEDGLYAKNHIARMNRAVFRSVGLENQAGRTGLEPATSAVTGRCSNQLNYRPTRFSILS